MADWWRPCVNDPVWLTVLRILIAVLGIVAALLAPFLIVGVRVWWRGGRGFA